MNATVNKPNMHQDNVYMKNPPRAYVPYAGSGKPYGTPTTATAPRDDGMVPMAVVGLVLTIMLLIPAGVFTGPAALKRARKLEHQVRAGRRPASDTSHISIARVCAWLSIAISIPLVIVWAFFVGVFVLALA